jgi:hypothetical protein
VMLSWKPGDNFMIFKNILAEKIGEKMAFFRPQ